VSSLAFIKSSICATFLRIVVHKVHRWIAWSIIIMSCVTSTIAFLGVTTGCRPLARTWDKSLPGDCMEPIVIVNLSYLISASSIVTDLACAILPIFILRETTMKMKAKVSVWAVLALGGT
jgi:hypothetical protein